MACIHLPNLNNLKFLPNFTLNVPIQSPIKYDTHASCQSDKISIGFVARSNNEKLSGLIASDFASVIALIRPLAIKDRITAEQISLNVQPPLFIACDIIRSRMLTIIKSYCSLSMGEYQALLIQDSWVSNSALEVSDIFELTDSSFQSGTISMTSESGVLLCAPQNSTFAIRNSEISCANMITIGVELNGIQSSIESCNIECSTKTILCRTDIKDSELSAGLALIASGCNFNDTTISLGPAPLPTDDPSHILEYMIDIPSNDTLRDIRGQNYVHDEDDNIIGATSYILEESPIQELISEQLQAPPPAIQGAPSLLNFGEDVVYFDRAVTHFIEKLHLNDIFIPQISTSGLISHLFVGCAFDGEVEIDDPILLLSQGTTVRGNLKAESIVMVEPDIVVNSPTFWAYKVGPGGYYKGTDSSLPSMSFSNRLTIAEGKVTAKGIFCGRVDIGASATLDCFALYEHINYNQILGTNIIDGYLRLRSSQVILSNMGIDRFTGRLILEDDAKFIIDRPLVTIRNFTGDIFSKGHLDLMYTDDSAPLQLGSCNVNTPSILIHRDEFYNPDPLTINSLISNNVSITDCRCQIGFIQNRGATRNRETGAYVGPKLSLSLENARLTINTIPYATDDCFDSIELKQSWLSIRGRKDAADSSIDPFIPEEPRIDYILSNVQAVNSILDLPDLNGLRKVGTLYAPVLENCSVLDCIIYEGQIIGTLTTSFGTTIAKTTVPILDAGQGSKIDDCIINSGIGVFTDTIINPDSYNQYENTIYCNSTTTLEHCDLANTSINGGSLICNNCNLDGLKGTACAIEISNSDVTKAPLTPDLDVYSLLKCRDMRGQFSASINIQGVVFETCLDIQNCNITGGGTFRARSDIRIKNSIFYFNTLDPATTSDIIIDSSDVGGIIQLKYSRTAPSACVSANDGPLRCKKAYGNIVLSNCGSTPQFKVLPSRRDPLDPRRPTHDSLVVTYNNCRISGRIDNIHTVIIRGGSVLAYSIICNTIYLYNTTIDSNVNIIAENVYIYNSIHNGTLEVGNLDWVNSVKQGAVWLLRPGYDINRNKYTWKGLPRGYFPP